ncbi:hypothetical protein JTB14_009648 [Gonioctena quinquepunctata]|nr:hypothetical protein JTB14_009648 [Gonioctena quinquepunctata]
MGGNIFAAVHYYLEDLKYTKNPFQNMHINRIHSALKSEIRKLKIDISRTTEVMTKRETKLVSRTFNNIGLVVPYVKNLDLGYRKLPLNDEDLSNLLTKLQNSKTDREKLDYFFELQPVLTYANIATDECDFGTGIELGWDLISHGVNLAVNYRLLEKEAFARIAEAHMKKRRNGSDLSIL